MMWLTIDYNDIDYDNDADHNDAMDDDNDATDDAIDTEQWADLVLRWAGVVGGWEALSVGELRPNWRSVRSSSSSLQSSS